MSSHNIIPAGLAGVIAGHHSRREARPQLTQQIFDQLVFLIPQSVDPAMKPYPKRAVSGVVSDKGVGYRDGIDAHGDLIDPF